MFQYILLINGANMGAKNKAGKNVYELLDPEFFTYVMKTIQHTPEDMKGKIIVKIGFKQLEYIVDGIQNEDQKKAFIKSFPNGEIKAKLLKGR